MKKKEIRKRYLEPLVILLIFVMSDHAFFTGYLYCFTIPFVAGCIHGWTFTYDYHHLSSILVKKRFLNFKTAFASSGVNTIGILTTPTNHIK